ncbi:MAG: rod shape-determining protein MreC [Acetatifactor sp.]|nr:rod shape-determining protein MreC [Acetatifactor sp.]
MSPVIKKKGEKFTLPSKYLLFILSVFCIILMLITFGTNVFHKPFTTAFGYVVVPFEKGISNLGGWLSRRSDELVQIRKLMDENEMLKEKVAELTEENTLLYQDRYELNKLRQLFELDQQYSQYDKVGARIIARDAGNWYTSFIIDKGADDGLEEDMNVIAGGGLVGRITVVGPNWSRVQALISDDFHVSGMTLSSEDNLIVSGNLQTMSIGVIDFSQLVDSKGQVQVGDKVVTSDISDKYLPGILIGYINTINQDANNLTKSGSITPVVDFEHLSEVLVITVQKRSYSEE